MIFLHVDKENGKESRRPNAQRLREAIPKEGRWTVACAGDADESNETQPHPADGGTKARVSPAGPGCLGLQRVTISGEQGFPPRTGPGRDLFQLQEVGSGHEGHHHRENHEPVAMAPRLEDRGSGQH